MIAMLLGLPSWVRAAIVGVALLSVLQVRHWWEVRALHGQVASMTQALDREKAAAADLRVGLTEVSANRDQLEARIREQNQAIALLQARGRELAAVAASRAAVALQRGAEASGALRAPATTVPPGHEAMNAWLHDRFPQ